jgi:hypothetical protein
MPWEVGEYFCFPELLSEFFNCGNYSWFCLEVGCACALPALKGGEHSALADFLKSS